MSVETEVLTSWNAGAARQAVVDFVQRVNSDGVPVEERVAVFENDGTLWCEKPLPIQADFILRRLFEMAQADPELRGRQPWKAAYERDYGWLGKVLAEHYAGDDTNLPALAGGILAAFGGITVEEFDAKSEAFLRTTQHPTLGRGYLECAYRPMIELLGYLAANGFSNYIASGGGRDFMRPISQEVYGIPRDRVIGSATSFEYADTAEGGTLTHGAGLDYLDDGPRSRSGSGAAPADGRSSLRATPTATSRCSSSPTIRTSRCFTYWCSTTTIGANSPTPAAPNKHSRRPTRAVGRSSA
jgi:hypothetical protein